MKLCWVDTCRDFEMTPQKKEKKRKVKCRCASHGQYVSGAFLRWSERWIRFNAALIEISCEYRLMMSHLAAHVTSFVKSFFIGDFNFLELSKGLRCSSGTSCHKKNHFNTSPRNKTCFYLFMLCDFWRLRDAKEEDARQCLLSNVCFASMACCLFCR